MNTTKPTKETLLLKEGDSFNMGQVKCTVTSTATFSGELHYGFTYVTVDGLYGCGWMPCFFVENFTGFRDPDYHPTAPGNWHNAEVIRANAN